MSCENCKSCECGSKRKRDLMEQASLAQVHNIYGVLGVLDVPTMKKELEDLKKAQDEE